MSFRGVNSFSHKVKSWGDEESHHYEYEILLVSKVLWGPHPLYDTAGGKVRVALSKREGLKIVQG